MHAPDDLFNPARYARVREPAARAVPLPNWCYTSPEFYMREVERIFMKVWNYVGHASQIPEAGDYFTIEITGAPVIIIRGDDGEIRAFHNSCRHRGSRVAWGEGSCKNLTCPYHNWTYARDGNLIATPLIDEDEDFSRADYPLLPVTMDHWAGFLFVNFDPACAPLADYLGDLPANCAAYAPENLVCARRKTYSVEGNWKLYFENYNDSLHIPFVHQGTLAKQKVKGRARSTHEETNGSYITHFTKHEGSRGLLTGETGFPPIGALAGRYQAGTYYPCLYPTVLFGWTIDCLWIFEIRPTGPETMDLVASSFFPKDRLERPDFEEVAARYYARIDTILPEDNEAVSWQQQGLRAPVNAASNFTHMETLCHAFDNWVLDQVLD
ncbi:MAG: Rieske 2Fe-2S domain-containing protein [Alphaproteobacteria bacterium]|nr:Rieske 2Fe-2S domain-containing protein [Alphaproteobacteria bacterium]